MLRRALAALGLLVGLWIVAVLVLFVWPPADSKPPAHADAVVVLSGGLSRRLPKALTLMRRRIAPVLVISTSPLDPRYAITYRLCSGREHLSYRVMCFRAHPWSTRGEARAVTALARTRRWTRVVVVTSTYHVTRARMLFRRCYHGRLWLVGASTPFSRLPREWALETAKLVVQSVFEKGC
jgi:uncharacterized SAM-binding protein YcdF (DUF218 family)